MTPITYKRVSLQKVRHREPQFFQIDNRDTKSFQNSQRSPPLRILLSSWGVAVTSAVLRLFISLANHIVQFIRQRIETSKIQKLFNTFSFRVLSEKFQHVHDIFHNVCEQNPDGLENLHQPTPRATAVCQFTCHCYSSIPYWKQTVLMHVYIKILLFFGTYFKLWEKLLIQ